MDLEKEKRVDYARFNITDVTNRNANTILVFGKYDMESKFKILEKRSELTVFSYSKRCRFYNVILIRERFLAIIPKKDLQ